MVRSTSLGSFAGLLTAIVLALLAAGFILLTSQPAVAQTTASSRITVTLDASARTVTVTDRGADGQHTRTETFQLADACANAAGLNCAGSDQIAAAQRLVGAQLVGLTWEERGILANDRLIATLAGGEQISLEIQWALAGW